ncbi:MAG: alcohol dehydrogenase catalytic domain-containing protein [Chloroflexota bacterium]|nr:alcohol dehydrogenase catalytic domain-containing protein [Chloroflexota bacterium]
MAQKVRAAVLVAASKIEMREFPMPEIGRDDALLKIELAGVCGTDPKRYEGKIKATAPFPVIMGHEILGRIAKIGDIASKRMGVKEGDRVVAESMVRCAYCSHCITGDYRFCENPRGYGYNVSATVPPYLWGAYAEYMYLAPGSIVHKISENVPAKAGVLINAVFADAFRWGRLEGGFCIGDAVVIQGVGQQGLCQVIVGKESGCNPIIATGLSKDVERFKLAKEFGADYTIDVEKVNVVDKVKEITGGKMADVVVDVAGSWKSISVSIDLVKKQGRLVLATIVGEETLTPIATDTLARRDITIVGVFSADYRSMGPSIKLVESGKYAIEKIVSHVLPLDQAERAVQMAGGYFKDIYPTKVILQP